MKILVTGDRNWTCEKTIGLVLERYEGLGATLIHGDCRGADRLAAKIGEQMGYKVMAFPADWKFHGKGAGPIRNQKMLDEKPDEVCAFHDNIEKSKGTADMVNRTIKAGIRTAIFKSAGKTSK